MRGINWCGERCEDESNDVSCKCGVCAAALVAAAQKRNKLVRRKITWIRQRKQGKH